MLIEKLQEQLAEFDKKAKSNVRLIQRQERLAYVTVNLTNIVQVVLTCGNFPVNAFFTLLRNEILNWLLAMKLCLSAFIVIVSHFQWFIDCF